MKLQIISIAVPRVSNERGRQAQKGRHVGPALLAEVQVLGNESRQSVIKIANFF
jgi:hypothetical protein